MSNKQVLNSRGVVTTTAPSNIALIKYMGKKPINASLSYTLEHLKTMVRISPSTEKDHWAPLSIEVGASSRGTPLELSAKSIDRFLNHFQFLKKHWGIEGFFKIESENNFPSDCGIASSASSFAALTKATALLVSEEVGLEAGKLAELSQKGSGSSCRSFFFPWSIWDESGARGLELPVGELLHCVVMADAERKTISSSKAHERVLTSPLFEGRQVRAQQRLDGLIQSFEKGDWADSYKICWDEFMDMHSLFHTSSPAFSYMNEKTKNILEFSQRSWSKNTEGPLVTMDAGANVHWLFRADQKALAQDMIFKLKPQFEVLSSWEES